MSEKLIDASIPQTYRLCAACLACRKAKDTAVDLLNHVMENANADIGEVLIDCTPAGKSVQNSLNRRLEGQIIFLKNQGSKRETVVIQLTDSWLARCPGFINDRNLMHEKSGRPDLIEDISLLTARNIK